LLEDWIEMGRGCIREDPRYAVVHLMACPTVEEENVPARHINVMSRAVSLSEMELSHAAYAKENDPSLVVVVMVPEHSSRRVKHTVDSYGMEIARDRLQTDKKKGRSSTGRR